jgi:putative redox protein
MGAASPPLRVELVWTEGLRFDATSGRSAAVVDADGAAGPSPMQFLAMGLAGCMAADVLDILRKGRHPIAGLRARLSGTRTPVPPRRFTAIHLQFDVQGDVPAQAVERAVALSREKYCSVWHSLRQDIDLTTGFEIRP